MELQQYNFLFDLLTRHTHTGLGDKPVDYNNLLNLPTSSNLNIKVGSGSRTTGEGTGSEAFTGIGFQPKGIIFMAWIGGADKGGWSICFADGTSYAGFLFYYFTDTSNFRNQALTSKLCLARSGSDYNTTCEATLTSFDTDGFTLSWDAVDLDTYFAYIVIG